MANPTGTNLHRQQLAPHHSHPGSRCRRSPEHGALLPEIQIGCWRFATCLRGKKASGESRPLDDDQRGITERNSLERRLFGSSTSMQALQTDLWSKSGPLATRARNPWRSHIENRRGREYPMSSQHGTVLSFGPFELSIGNMLLANGAKIVPLGARHGYPHRPSGAGKQGRRQENPDRARFPHEFRQPTEALRTRQNFLS